VVVKTPVLPIVVSPPATGATGQWQIEARTDGVDARFVATDGTLLGFALAGQATTNKAALQKTLPALLA
jgi:rubredoxin-NAD+ reductase